MAGGFERLNNEIATHVVIRAHLAGEISPCLIQRTIRASFRSSGEQAYTACALCPSRKHELVAGFWEALVRFHGFEGWKHLVPGGNGYKDDNKAARRRRLVLNRDARL